MSNCEVCGKRVTDFADFCERHAMTNEQYAEMWRRIEEAVRQYKLEIWGPEFRDDR